MNASKEPKYVRRFHEETLKDLTPKEKIGREAPDKIKNVESNLQKLNYNSKRVLVESISEFFKKLR